MTSEDLGNLEKLAAKLVLEAKEGERSSAMHLLRLATFAASELRHVTRRHPAILNGIRKYKQAVVLVRNGKPKRWQSSVKAAAAKLGLNLPLDGNDNRKGKSKSIPLTRFADKLLNELLELRAPPGVNEFGTHYLEPGIIHKILSPSGWHPPIHKNGIQVTDVLPCDYIIQPWKGWKHAAQFLPEPSSNSVDVWWTVALACLKERYTELWYCDEAILNIVKSKPTRVSPDKSQMRADIGKKVEFAFRSAVKRWGNTKGIRG
jgi:hypothetical protein